MAELGLRLALKLRVCELHGDDRGETLAAVLARDAVALLEDVLLPAVGIQRARECRLEAGLVHAALGRVDVVREGDEVLVVPVVILHRDLALAVFALAGHVDAAGVQRALVAVEIGHVFADAALVVHALADRLELVAVLVELRALVRDGDAQSRVQKRLLAHALVQDLIVVFQRLEHLGIGLEAHGRAGAVGLADDGDVLRDIAAGELHLMDLPVLVHLDLEPFGEGVVDDRGAHAVQAAGDLVAPAAELAARVQHGEHDLERALARLRLNVHGDAAAVVAHADDVAFLDRHFDMIAVARQRLVDGVVHDLIHEMVETRRGGGADVHARTLPDGLQPLQHLNLTGVIFLCDLVCDVCHVVYLFRVFLLCELVLSFKFCRRRRLLQLITKN